MSANGTQESMTPPRSTTAYSRFRKSSTSSAPWPRTLLPPLNTQDRDLHGYRLQMTSTLM